MSRQNGVEATGATLVVSVSTFLCTNAHIYVHIINLLCGENHSHFNDEETEVWRVVVTS